MLYQYILKTTQQQYKNNVIWKETNVTNLHNDKARFEDLQYSGKLEGCDRSFEFVHYMIIIRFMVLLDKENKWSNHKGVSFLPSYWNETPIKRYSMFTFPIPRTGGNRGVRIVAVPFFPTTPSVVEP